jgi:ATP phosphoribosyltransferase
MQTNNISFALPKGRLAEDTIKLLIDRGLTKEGVVDFSSRKLIFDDEENGIRFMLIRNTDVPVYVEHGAADFGVVGKDVLSETGVGIYEFADLGFGACRLSVAGPADEEPVYSHNMRIATKYPNITKAAFAQKGIFVEIIKLYGSIEIAPLTDLSDYIVDLVESGATLKGNGLREYEVLMHSTARLVANRSLSRVKHDRVKVVLDALGL